MLRVNERVEVRRHVAAIGQRGIDTLPEWVPGFRVMDDRERGVKVLRIGRTVPEIVPEEDVRKERRTDE